jgi:hypothetical protein
MGPRRVGVAQFYPSLFPRHHSEFPLAFVQATSFFLFAGCSAAGAVLAKNALDAAVLLAGRRRRSVRLKVLSRYRDTLEGAYETCLERRGFVLSKCADLESTATPRLPEE